MKIIFGNRKSVEEVEEGNELQPKFDNQGLIPAITVEYNSNEILMHGYMNEEALRLSIETKKAHYWSRSRKSIWKKGEVSGLYQTIKQIKIDDDQDCIILFVDLEGLQASCHVGYKSCFYREISKKNDNFSGKLKFTENEKVFDPKKIYGDTPNPTKL
ncbi:MAG: phosphoribosyl-AMP cyclohydrolase [Alphaproteobacteria bacterium]|tara:strand:+ start:3908 stop:4381 length:474 start_codon:yes stop_codon:yes gene_type:complete